MVRVKGACAKAHIRARNGKIVAEDENLLTFLLIMALSTRKDQATKSVCDRIRTSVWFVCRVGRINYVMKEAR